jgi:hypothetical protein
LQAFNWLGPSTSASFPEHQAGRPDENQSFRVIIEFDIAAALDGASLEGWHRSPSKAHASPPSWLTAAGPIKTDQREIEVSPLETSWSRII